MKTLVRTTRSLGRRAAVPALALGLVGAAATGAQAGVADGVPFGNGFDRLLGVTGGIETKGWAIDPNTTAPIQVIISIDGRNTVLTADKTRLDVEKVFPGWGSEHGFSATLPASAGVHEVCVTFDNVGAGNDANVGCRSVTVPSSSSSTTTTLSGRPGSSNTGAPSGTLRVINGDLKITTRGTVLDGVDIRGYVSIQADDVTIRNSVIRGGAAPSTDRALVMAWWGYKNLVIEDTTLVPSAPSVYTDGISGSNFTARRLDISGVVDPVKVIGNNVTVVDSWLHDTFHSRNDPTQSDGFTHDDSVQITGGSNILLRGNLMEDSHNAAIMVSQGYAITSQVRIESNWLGDGVCTINVTQAPRNTPIQGMTISNNRFAPGSEDTRCPMRLPDSSPISVSGNVWDATGLAAKPNWF